MRKIIALCVMVLLFSVSVSAQRCYVYTTQTVNGGSLDVDVYVQNTSTPFVMGTSSFVVGYDPAVIASPVIVPENDGPWSTADADYWALSSMDHPGSGYADMVVFFNGGADHTGATVGSTPVRVGTLRFTIMNAVAAEQLTWRGLANVTQMTALADPGVDVSYRDITDSCAYTTLKLRSFLQSPWTAGAMNTTLRDAGLVPLAQPYNTAPWSYTGTESVASVPAGVVDWVLVELRSDTAGTTKIATQAAFLKSDGTIVGSDGSELLGFRGVDAGSYHVVVRHRNHLAVMTSNTVSNTTTTPEYDFTTGLDKYHGGDAKELAAGVYGMWAGDVTGNGIVKYNLAGNDRLRIFQRIGGVNVNATVNGYYPEDVNLNGQVKYNLAGNDRLMIFQVIGGTNVNATRSTRVPN